jgi:hypothetical protein
MAVSVLDRAKALQLKVASETQFWVRLDLLEGLIAEIERLQTYERAHPATAPASVRDIHARHQLKGDPS